MNLTEFLLARIAEDEYEPTGQADCEAKRRIVESHWDGTPDPDFPELLLADCPECRQIQPCRTLRMLSLPYADHPDYDERWRL